MYECTCTGRSFDHVPGATDGTCNDPNQIVEKIVRVRVSPMFTAMLDHILEIDPPRTSPAIDDMCITSDGMLLVQHAGDIGLNNFVGGADDLFRNLQGVGEVAELTDLERADLLSRVALRVHDWRRRTA